MTNEKLSYWDIMAKSLVFLRRLCIYPVQFKKTN